MRVAADKVSGTVEDAVATVDDRTSSPELLAADMIKFLPASATAFALAEDRDDVLSMAVLDEPVPVGTVVVAGSRALDGTVFGTETAEDEEATGVSCERVSVRFDNIESIISAVVGIATASVLSDFDPSAIAFFKSPETTG